LRHRAQWIGGDRSEDHLAACCWNCFAYIRTEQWIKEGQLPTELDDLSHAKKDNNSTSPSKVNLECRLVTGSRHQKSSLNGKMG